jgi:hypothetical protein
MWFLARPLVLDAARVKENCFSLSFIAAPSCQTWRRVSTGNSCRVSGGVGPTQKPGRAAGGQRPGNAREAARFWGKPGQRRPVPGTRPPSNRPGKGQFSVG